MKQGGGMRVVDHVIILLLHRTTPSSMDKVKIFERLEKGETVYIIDDWDNCAIKYAPELGKDVMCKSPGCPIVTLPMSNKLIFESTLYGDEVTKEAFERY